MFEIQIGHIDPRQNPDGSTRVFFIAYDTYDTKATAVAAAKKLGGMTQVVESRTVWASLALKAKRLEIA